MTSPWITPLERRLKALDRQGCVPLENANGPIYSRIYVFCIVAALCAYCDLRLPSKVGLTLSGAVFFGASAILALREARGAKLILTPIVCYQLWQSVSLGLAPVYTGLRYREGDTIPFSRFDLSLEQVAAGHALLVTGAAALYAGMALFRPRERVGSNQDVRSPSALRLLALFGLGILLSVFNDSITKYAGSMVAGLSLLPVGVLCLLSSNPPARLRRRDGMQVTCISLGSLVILLVALNSGGAKLGIMWSFFPLVWCFIQKRWWRTLFWTGLCLCAFYLFAVTPFISVSRDVLRDETGRVRLDSRESNSNLADGLLETFHSDSTAYALNWLDSTMTRVGDASAAGGVKMLADDDGLLNGEGLAYLPTAFIPRMFWPEKPIIEPGRWFTFKLGMASDPSVATTSTGQTPAGELYWNFGWSGMILGMFVLGGSVGGGLWRAAGVTPQTGVLEMTAYTTAMLTFFLGTGSAAGSNFVGNISASLLFLTLIVLRNKLFPRGRPAMRHSGPQPA